MRCSYQHILLLLTISQVELLTVNEFQKQLKTCHKKYPYVTKELAMQVTRYSQHLQEGTQCGVACVLKGLGLIQNGQINLDNYTKYFKIKYDDPEQHDAAIKGVKTCKQKVKEMNDCQLALKFINCMADYVQKNNLNLDSNI